MCVHISLAPINVVSLLFGNIFIIASSLRLNLSPADFHFAAAADHLRCGSTSSFW